VDEGVLTPKLAFMTLFLYDTVRISVNFLPQLSSYTIMAIVSLHRLLKFLNQEERPVKECYANGNSSNGVDNNVVGKVFLLILQANDFQLLSKRLHFPGLANRTSFNFVTST
jgi:hypothetical protein